MFEPNQKVICVNDTFLRTARLHAYIKSFPVKGQIYTVRDIIPAQGYQGEHTCAVLLDEIVNPHNDIKGRGEFGFACHRFRALTQDEAREMMEATRPMAETE